MINGRQIKAARALLNITQAELVEMSGISFITLKRLEGKKPSNPKSATLNKIETVFNKKGIEFKNNNEESGVMLKKPKF